MLVYRPPRSTVNDDDDLINVLYDICSIPGPLLVLGDFNLSIDWINNVARTNTDVRFKETFICCNLKQKLGYSTTVSFRSLFCSRDSELQFCEDWADKAPDKSEDKKDMKRALSLLSARKELLVVADGDLSVFAFYNQQKRAKITKDPYLAVFLVKKIK
ncbi:hypothetical protein GCK32_007482 [Trichostrongylus colubriformis]|uniref:Endonuclease/exonuclease/phosphatase domain-containing protein n=1 Tax=Trichostrongylus colubriformis TaxID=6319 RepID=A0AAN8F5U4_TRICO